MQALLAGTDAITLPDLRWSRCDIKVISLIANCMANQQAKEAGAYEAILVRDGVALEGTHTSFFYVKDGVIHTAPLSNLILPGVTRGIVIEAAVRAGMEVRESAVRAELLPGADELFIAGTTIEVTPILKLDGGRIGAGKPGPVTLRLQDLYRAAAGIA
jgi:D-alanine transaminase